MLVVQFILRVIKKNRTHYVYMLFLNFSLPEHEIE